MLNKGREADSEEHDECPAAAHYEFHAAEQDEYLAAAALYGMVEHGRVWYGTVW